MMMKSPVRILGAFVDTLVMNVYPTNGQFEIERVEMSPALKTELEQWKKLAQDREEDIPSRFIFGGSNLLMRTKGSEGFNWILRNDKITLAVNRSSKMQLWAQVRCSSAYLWSVRDLGKVVSDVHVFLMSIFGQLITLQPSSVDLAVDVFGLDLRSIQDVKERFVSRAQLTGLIPSAIPEDGMIDGPDAIKQRWGRLTGLPFGSRSGALSALIYDKSHEIRYHSPEKAWFWDLWQHEAEKQHFCLLPTARIWRVELRFKRQALNELQGDTFHGINDAYDLEAHIPGLWAYAVGHLGGAPVRSSDKKRAKPDWLPDGWLRYIIPTDDTNRSRWPVHPDWEVIQSAFTPVAVSEPDYEQEQRERDALLSDLDAYLASHPHAPSDELRPFASPDPEVMDTHEPALPAPSSLSPVPFDLAPYIRKRKVQVNMRRMVAQIAGCLITAEAWRRSAPEDDVEPDISSTVHFIYGQVQAYLAQTGRDFTESVQKKRVLYHLAETLAQLDHTIDNRASA